jgi:hypothetical protein
MIYYFPFLPFLFFMVDFEFSILHSKFSLPSGPRGQPNPAQGSALGSLPLYPLTPCKGSIIVSPRTGPAQIVFFLFSPIRVICEICGSILL